MLTKSVSKWWSLYGRCKFVLVRLRIWLDGQHVLDGELLREQPDDVPERRDVREPGFVSVLLLHLCGGVLWLYLLNKSVYFVNARALLR